MDQSVIQTDPYEQWRQADETISLHPGQFDVYSNPARFKVMVAGRRSGKTHLARTILKKQAGYKNNKHVWYIAPTYRQAKQIMWRELKDSVPRNWVAKSNETNLEIDLKNKSRIRLKGADNPDTLRGVALDYVVFDEVQDIDPYVWNAVIAPTLATTGGGALFTGTPKSFGFLYDLYQKGQDKEELARGLWKSWQSTTASSPFVPTQEIEVARRDLDPMLFEQEYMATFLSMTGVVYHAFDRTEHVGDYKFDPSLPIWIGQDFNVNPMSAIIMQYHEDSGEIWVVDEVVQFKSDTLKCYEEIERRYFRWRDNTLVFPDPAGDSGQHARGETSLDIIREKGYKNIHYHRQHPPVRDRVNCVNRMLRNARGDVRFRVDRSCKQTIASFEQTMWKEDKVEIEKKSSMEHATDALGYCVHFMFPMRTFISYGASY